MQQRFTGRTDMLLLWPQGGARSALTALLSDGNTVADYQPFNFTGTTNASAWLNSVTSGWGAPAVIAGSLLQASGAAQPTINADGSLTFDGIAQYMGTDAFTLNQPITYYLVLKQVAYTAGRVLLDGLVAASVLIQQQATTPNIRLYAGIPAAENVNATVGTAHVISAVFSGASSSLRVDTTVATTGDAGAQNAGAMFVGRSTSGVAYSNIQVWEIIARNVADSAATQAQKIMAALKAIYGTP